MKSIIIEGIPDSKIERLKKHLLKAEIVGKDELRKTPRYDGITCPIMSFAPKRTKEGTRLFFTSPNATISSFEPYEAHQLYALEDSIWWTNLPDKSRIAITRHIQQWIKEGKKL